MATLGITIPPRQQQLAADLVSLETLPLVKPGGGVQFGRKHILTIGDHRPLVTFPAYQDGTCKTVAMGIKPPTFGPTLAFNATNASGLPADSDIFVVYAFWSSARQTMSEISPWSHITTAGTAKQLVVSGFQAPRDGAIESEIDTILVGLQFGQSGNYMCLWGQTTVVRSDYYLPAASITIDLSGSQLAGGFALDTASIYSMVPPAAKYVAKFGERLWLAGQEKIESTRLTGLTVSKATRTTVAASSAAAGYTLYVNDVSGWETGDAFVINLGSQASPNLTEANVVVSTTAGSPGYITTFYPLTYTQTSGTVTRTHRGRAVAKVSGPTMGDLYMWMNLFVNGQFLGVIFDIKATDLWLDRDIPTDIASTYVWHLEGNNDRIWPTSYHNFTPGGVPTAFPESINIADAVNLAPVVDGSELLTGVQACQDSLFIPMSKTVMVMTGGTAVNTPDINIRTDFGSVGASAPGTLTQSDTAELFWVNQNGFTAGQPGGIQPISANLGLLQFFKDPRWLSEADLVSMVATFSRQYSGYVVGNFTINGASGFWGLLSLQPQIGFWLFSGQLMTSNILVYQNDNGEDVILCGDSYGGRTKKLMDTAAQLQDVPCWPTTPTGFVAGYESPTLTNIQGYTTDGTFHYTSRLSVLGRRYMDADWTLATQNTSPFGSTGATTLYDGCYYNNKLYFCAYDSSGGATSWLIVYDAYTLAILQEVEITAQLGSDRAISCTVDAANGILYVLPWNSNVLYKYNLNASLAYLSSLALTGASTSNQSGIYYNGTRFYMITENAGVVYTITTGGVKALLFTPATSVDSVGLDFSQRELRMGRHTLVGYFDPTPQGSDTPAAYNCLWREGWSNLFDGRQFTPSIFRLTGCIAPDRTTMEIVPTIWQDDYAEREEEFMAGGYATALPSVTQAEFNNDVPIPPKLARWMSLGIAWSSTDGAAIGYGVEPTSWQTLGAAEGS